MLGEIIAGEVLVAVLDPAHGTFIVSPRESG